MIDALLHLDGVSVTHGTCRLLDVPSLTIDAGQRVGVTGPIGAGKTTLLRAAAGLVDLSSGVVTMSGRHFHSGRAPGALEMRRRMAFVQQEPCLFATSVEENILAGLSYRGVKNAEGRKRCAAWLDRLGLGGLARRDAAHLSGGERRLVALARALVLEPVLLFLDEPTAHLDQAAAARVESLLREALPGSTTLVLATHDMAQAERLSSRVLQMESGKIHNAAPLPAAPYHPHN
jgi:tungstate transport system ATP-binding protein